MQIELSFLAEAHEKESLRHHLDGKKYFNLLKEIIEQAWVASRNIDTSKDHKNIFLRSDVSGNSAAFIYAGLLDLLELHEVAMMREINE